jgi:hypothetical protein
MFRILLSLFGIYLPHPDARFNRSKANVMAALVYKLKLKNLVINPQASVDEASRELDRWGYSVYPDYYNFKQLTNLITNCYGSPTLVVKAYWNDQLKQKGRSEEIGLIRRQDYRYVTYNELYLPLPPETRHKIIYLEKFSDEELINKLREQTS